MAGTLLAPPSGIPLERLVQMAVERGYTAQGEMFSGELGAEGSQASPVRGPCSSPQALLEAGCLHSQPSSAPSCWVAGDKQLTLSVPHFLHLYKDVAVAVMIRGADPQLAHGLQPGTQ